MPYPQIDDALAAESLAAAGATTADAIESVVSALRGWLPGGSTAKWRAIDRGDVPPGVDPQHALEARLAGDLASWSCWSICTSVGGVLAALGHDVRLAVEQLRQGAHRPDVDFHSVLIVDGRLVDPFLGPSAPIAVGHDESRADAWGAWVPGDRPDHVGARGGSGVFRYRQLGDRLDRRDVETFCRISVTHSGVGRRRTAHWLRDGQLWFVREPEGSGVAAAELRVTEGESPFCARRRLVARGEFDDLTARVADRAEPDAVGRANADGVGETLASAACR